jgi:hypothetical protein
MNEWPAGPLDFLLRQNREQNARATAAAATAAATRPEAIAPAPVATAVEDLLARHEAAGKLLRACLALHDCDRGQHSSDLLIAVSNIKLAAKRSNKQNGDSPYLDAVAAAIASDCQQCHLLIARKVATQAELAETAIAKLKAMQQVVLEYPASAGEFVRAPPEADVTCDKCGLGWSAELPFLPIRPPFKPQRMKTPNDTKQQFKIHAFFICVAYALWRAGMTLCKKLFLTYISRRIRLFLITNNTLQECHDG